MKKINIAIDGYSATGKSETSKNIARSLNYKYLDSGALYRATSLYLNKNNILPQDIKESDLKKINLEFRENNVLFLNNENITFEIRSEKISKITPHYAKKRIVRKFLEKIQKEIIQEGGYVTEGRDIGTNIMPNAQVKIFLTGDLEIRAKRRQEQLKKRGILESFEEVREELENRDHQDINRDFSPLVKARDAIEIDTSNLSQEDQDNFILKIINNYLNKN